VTLDASISVLDREFYPVGEAARLLRVPPSTLRWWLEGRTFRDRVYPPVIREQPRKSALVTWGEFVEAGYLRAYRSRDVPLRELRHFVDALRQEFGISYPLAHFQPFVSDQRRLVLELQSAAKLPIEFWVVVEATTGQLLLTSVAESFLERVEFSSTDDRAVVRLFPAGKDSPVVMDPRRAFGAPSVHGVRTDALAELIDAGEPPEEVAESFGLDVALVKAAVAYEWTLAA
jgi:uncharacterized protein (DUF433 family)/DNA-binding transcriptional MerR regulator